MKKLWLLLLISAGIVLPIMAMKRARSEEGEPIEAPVSKRQRGLTVKFASKDGVQFDLSEQEAKLIPLVYNMIKDLGAATFTEETIPLASIESERLGLLLNIVKKVLNAPVTKIDPLFFNTYSPDDIPAQVRLIVQETLSDSAAILADCIDAAVVLDAGWLIDALTTLWVEKKYTVTDAKLFEVVPGPIQDIAKKESLVKEEPSRLDVYSIADIVALEMLPDLTEDGTLILKEKNIVNLVGIGLISANFRNKIKSLNLIGNNITLIPDYAFIKLENLKELFLTANQLTFISDNALTGLNKLQYLELQGNELKKVPNFNLPELIFLYLHDNKLIMVPDFNLPKLQRLHLQYNKLTSVPNFKYLSSLKRLYLTENNLFAIPNFEHLKALKRLFLEYNNISEVPNFTHLQQLVLLVLNYNRLKHIPNFVQLNSLQELYVEGNELSDVPNFNLPRLEELDVSNNTLTSIPDFAHLTSLEILELSNNLLTNAGIPNLNHLSNHLEQLFLKGNDLSQDDIDRLQQELPQTQIYFEGAMEEG